VRVLLADLKRFYPQEERVSLGFVSTPNPKNANQQSGFTAEENS